MNVCGRVSSSNNVRRKLFVQWVRGWKANRNYFLHLTQAPDACSLHSHAPKVSVSLKGSLRNNLSGQPGAVDLLLAFFVFLHLIAFCVQRLPLLVDQRKGRWICEERGQGSAFFCPGFREVPWSSSEPGTCFQPAAKKQEIRNKLRSAVQAGRSRQALKAYFHSWPEEITFKLELAGELVLSPLHHYIFHPTTLL